MKRRQFIKMTAMGAAGTMLPPWYLNAITDVFTPASPHQLGAESESGLGTSVLKPPSMITPNDKFYAVQIRQPPRIKVEDWRLAITGLVENPVVLSYADITTMKSVTTMRTLKCIGDPIGTRQMSNAMWTGVPLRDILQKAGVKNKAKLVVFRCADGYHTAVPTDRATRAETLLAYKMNSEVLPRDHGFPVRLLNPGHYGTKNPKWIVNIQLAETHEGYWEKRGWDPVARVKLATLIGRPADSERLQGGTRYTISGAAFDSGNHDGIEGVEVSLDGGDTWEETEIWASSSPLTWYLWKYTWQVPAEGGKIDIYARAISNDGLIQEEAGFDVEPAGTVGYHTISAEIV